MMTTPQFNRQQGHHQQMVKRLLIPATLELHCISLLIYYGDMYLYPLDYKLFGWAAYFHCSQVLFLSLFCLAFIFISKKSIFDNQFLLIEFLLCMALFVGYSLQGLGFIVHTYALIFTVIAIAITTLSIIFSA